MINLVNKLVKTPTLGCIQWLKINEMQIRICILIDKENFTVFPKDIFFFSLTVKFTSIYIQFLYKPQKQSPHSVFAVDLALVFTDFLVILLVRKVKFGRK